MLENETYKCPMYEKHHNIIDGIYMPKKPETWEDIPYMDDIDAEDESGELYLLFLDAKIYDIEELEGFILPSDKHNIKETIFIIRRNGDYYLCETQSENLVKFSTKISNLNWIRLKDRKDKISKLYDKIHNSNSE